ncbi:MAG TPA: TonB-dependent receptor plug domain-containing protein [Edaphocola sp.]|nr:TonB-dependent receptor plug domain-containing protein [Edaphocola sp.]
MKKLLQCSTLFLLASTASTFAGSGIVTGKITDKSNQAIDWATVYIEELKKATYLNEDGTYRFDSIPSGIYTVAVIIPDNTTVKHKLVHQGEHSTLDIVLDVNVGKLNDHIVWARSKKAEIEMAGYAANVIETGRAALQNIQTNELLDRTAGVRIRQSGGLGSNIEYNINGLSGNAVRILIDGVPVHNYGPSFSLNSIPPALIERVEIYKGVTPPHLSDDALGGAINIVLKKASTNSIVASYGAGSFGTHQGNITGFYRNQQSGFTVNASGFYNYTDNSYKVWGDKVYTTDPSNGKILRGNKYKRFHDAYRSYGGKVELGFSQVKWADEFYVGALFSDMYNEIQHGATMEVVYGNRFATQGTQLANLVYKKRNLFVPGLDLNVLATYSWLQRDVVDTIADRYNWDGSVLGKWANGGEQGKATLQNSNEHTRSVRANLRYAVSQSSYLGVNYLFADLSRKMDDPYLPQAEREFLRDRSLHKNFVGFHYEQHALHNKLTTTLFYKYYQQGIKTTDVSRKGPGGGGTQYQEIAHSDQENGFGLAVSYAFSRKFTLVASAERAIRFPENNEVFGNNADNILPNPNLKPEHSLNGNLGIFLGPFKPANSQHSIGFSGNVFVRNTKDMIRQGVPSAISETFSFENLNNVVSTGFDAELKYDYARKLLVIANASLFNARFNTQFDANGSPFFYYRSRLRNAPYFTANLSARYDWQNAIQHKALLSLSYNFAYVHEFLRDWEGVGGANLDFVPAQVLHDLGLTYTFPNKKITIGFDAKNIFDHQAFDNWALQKPGRAFFGKITYRIL